LHVVWNQVSDVSGLAKLTSLIGLYLFSNPLSDLTPLSELRRLRSLHLSSTMVSDLSPLSGLRDLRDLSLSKTRVTDLSPLRGLAELTSLDLNGTPVDDISALAKLPLRVLKLSGTRVTNLSAISNLRSLLSLDLSDTQISKLDELSKLEYLRLDVEHTNVSDVTALKNLRRLKSLNLKRTNVHDLKPIAELPTLDQLNLDHAQVRDLSPVASLESLLQNVIPYDFGGLSFSGCPLADRYLLGLAGAPTRERTTKTIAYLRRQQALPPLPELLSDDKQSTALQPLDNVSSPFEFHLSPGGTIALAPSQANWPIFPLRTSERDYEQRLDVCRTLSKDLIADLESNRFQARPDYLEGLEKYVERLPTKRGDGNILLADAEARTLRNLFAAEADILSVAFASKLKTFLEQHMGLRVFYPEIASFYRDVQNGRIEAPLSLDAIEGFVQGIKENSPTIFDPSVEEAIEGSAESAPSSLPVQGSEKPATEPGVPVPPKDPLGDIDPQRASDFSFAGVVNSVWRTFLQGERIYKAAEAWNKAGSALRPHVNEILGWLYRFVGPGDVPPTPPTLGV
jgi:Leucine Rich repeats (2 copies)